MSGHTLNFPTFSQAILPSDSRGVRFMEAAAFSLLTALAAQIEIRLPFTPVPITGQTFSVLLTGMLLGSRWGSLSIGLYVLEGLLGAPVFAGGAAGPLVLAGPTGGYIVGFVPAAWLAGRLAERGWDRRPLTAAAAMFLGSLVIFVFGVIGLLRFISLPSAVALGFIPFLPGDAVKIALASAALPLGWKALGR